jgi:hypothetical protein
MIKSHWVPTTLLAALPVSWRRAGTLIRPVTDPARSIRRTGREAGGGSRNGDRRVGVGLKNWPNLPS